MIRLEYVDGVYNLNLALIFLLHTTSKKNSFKEATWVCKVVVFMVWFGWKGYICAFRLVYLHYHPQSGLCHGI